VSLIGILVDAPEQRPGNCVVVGLEYASMHRLKRTGSARDADRIDLELGDMVSPDA
jgi:hypothetical protein